MIARELFRAELGLRQAEDQLDELLDSLFGDRPDDWSDYHYDRSDRSLEVFSVIPADAAFDALVRAGFQRVWLHDHSRDKFLRCACKPKSVS